MKLLSCLAVSALLLLAACSPREPVSVASLARRLADPLEPARLDVPGAILHSSWDRTGENDDYGFFLRPSSTPGWRVLAEFTGPGYLSRFWFTGAKASAPFRFRFYVDGNPVPAFEGDVLEFCSGTLPPLLPPLANYEQYAWYSFLPVPYAKSLRIECQDPPPGAKPYFQFAEMPLPKGTPVVPFSWPLPPEDLAALDALRAAWSAPLPAPPNSTSLSFDLRPSPAPDAALATIPGPALVSRIEFAPDFSALPPARRDAFLRDAWVSFRYGSAPFESVAAPLGDLCGVPWQRVSAPSRFFGMSNDVLFLDFPVPVPDSLSIRVTVPDAARIPLRLTVRTSPLPAGKLGLFHASWRRTTPADVGTPHLVSALSSPGKFLGCLLSVASLDPSFWVLEGDESIALDSPSPAWLGTGLEDYFNAAWYYQNPLASPTHGLLSKAPFRTVQYRVHLSDPPRFSSSFRMAFERGPHNASRAFFESLAWFYLPAPAKADSTRLPPSARSAPSTPRTDLSSLLPTLWNLERLGDLPHARDALAARLASPPSAPDADFPFGSARGPLRALADLRLALYDAALSGASPLPALQAAAASPDDAVAAPARILLSESAGETATALLYANMPATVYLDGRPVLSNDSPDDPSLAVSAAALPLSPGTHHIAIRTPVHPYPDWVLFALRRSDGFFFSTSPEWRTAFDAPDEALLPAYDDSAWTPVTPAAICKGPPEEPYIYVPMDPYILLQSRAAAIRPLPDKPPRAAHITYRATFTLP